MPAANYITTRDLSLAKPIRTWDAQEVLKEAVVLAGPAFLIAVTGVNQSGSTRYIMLFDRTTLTAVAPAASIPKLCPVPVATGATFTLTMDGGMLAFETGIVWASSSTFNTLTLTGAADVWLTATYL